MDTTLYEIAEDILDNISYIIETEEKNYCEKLFKFLTTNSKYDHLIQDSLGIIEEKDIPLIKKLMILIVYSDSYKMAIHDMDHDIGYRGAKAQIDDMESILEDENSFENIIQLFLDKDSKEEVINYISDYFAYTASNYIYKNDCLNSVLEEDKVKELLQINPFEVLKFLDIIDEENILNSERDLQDYINIINKSYSDLSEEASEDEITVCDVQEKMIELVIDTFKDDRRIKQLYGYVFSNVYENLKLLPEEDETLKENLDIIAFMEDDLVNLEVMVKKYCEDGNFFDRITHLFIAYNETLDDGQLASNRFYLKQNDGYETMKKFNPYYEEEEYVFSHYYK